MTGAAAAKGYGSGPDACRKRSGRSPGSRKVFMCEPEIIPIMVCGEGDGGVSEVVSTVLMVALVVAFAGIAGMMVLGVELPGEPKTVVVTATRSGDAITFMNHGGMNMDKVTGIRCWIGGVDPANMNFPLGIQAGAINTSNAPGPTRVVVVGEFVDGESWILLDKTV